MLCYVIIIILINNNNCKTKALWLVPYHCQSTQKKGVTSWPVPWNLVRVSEPSLQQFFWFAIIHVGPYRMTLQIRAGSFTTFLDDLSEKYSIGGHSICMAEPISLAAGHLIHSRLLQQTSQDGLKQTLRLGVQTPPGAQLPVSDHNCQSSHYCETTKSMSCLLHDCLSDQSSTLAIGAATWCCSDRLIGCKREQSPPLFHGPIPANQLAPASGA